MKNSRVFLSIIGILLVLSLIWSFSSEESVDKPGLKGVFTAVKEKVIGQSLSESQSGEEAAQLGASEDKAAAPVDPVQKMEQFSAFIKTEAQSLDHAHVNTQERQTALQDRANKLDEVEKNHLKTVTLNNSLPINERILSVYLLSLNRDGGSSQSLANEIAQSPLPDYGPSSPHSEAEIRNAQELALRYMAIDKLVQDFKLNPPDSPIAETALEDLKTQSQQNPIPQVRKYAHDELNKIQVK